MFGLIVGCEIAFWVVLLGGLGVRYLLNWRRLSTLLLMAVPLIDIVLLIATIVDLRRGTVADFSHGLAAAYLGFTVAFGHKVIQWTDERVAHRFGEGPKPWRPPESGAAYARYEWVLFGHAVLGYGVSCALILAAIMILDQPEQTEALWVWIPLLGSTLVFWFIFGPLWFTLFPKKTRKKPSTSVKP